MTSWLSGGLSQFSSITDQISTFTKDVLSETTEEIEDPTAELQVARRKIQQLEEVNGHYKTEWEKLQRHSEEVREQAETAECQIAAISQEYRKLIQEKDAELRRLRTETASLKEQQRKIVSSGGRLEASSTSPLSKLGGERAFFSGSRGGRGGRGEWEVAQLEPVVTGGGWEGEEVGRGEGEGGGWGEYHDFGDVISSQGEINRLQMELTRLRAESKHWRALAEEKGHSTDTLTSGPVETELASLREQIEELQLCLQRERSQHQHQLSALEASHNEKLRSLSSHTHAIDSTRETSGKDGDEGEEEASVKVQLREAMGEGGESGGGRREESADETIRGSLLSSLEEVSLEEEMDGGGVRGRRRGKDESTVVAALQSQLAESREMRAKLESELVNMTVEVNRLREERGEGVERERVAVESLRAEVESLNSQLVALQREQVEAEGARQREVESLKVESLNSQLVALQREQVEAEGARQREVESLKVESLNSQLVALQREQVEGVRQREVESLKREVETLEEELRASRESLERRLSEAESSSQELRGRLQSVTNEKTEVEVKAKELAATLHAQKEVVGQLHGEVEHLKRQFLQERDSYTRHVEQEKAQLTSVVTELQDSISQHEEVIASLGTQCRQSQRDAETLSLQVDQLVAEAEGKDHQLQQREHSNEKSVGEDDRLVRERLQESNSAILDLQENLRKAKAEMEESLRRVNAENEECLRRVNEEKEESIRRVISEKEELVRALNSSLATIKLEKHELETGMEKLKVKESSLREQVEVRLRVGNETLAREESETNKVREELRASEERRSQIENLLLEKESVVTRLESETKVTREGISQLTADHAAIEARLAEKEMLIEHSEKNLGEVGRLLASRDEEIATLQRAGGEDSSSTDDGRDHGAMTRERDELLVQVRTTQSEVQGLQSSLTESRATLDSLNCKLREASTRNLELEQAMEAAQRETEGERERLEKRTREVEEGGGRAREELAAKQTECGKLVRQLDHLKAHLVQIEERYTQDALRAEERERGERKRAEETLRHSSYMDQQENLQTRVRVADLEEQLHVLATQRDAAILELSSAREEAEGSATALSNLQSVLEQFQRDKSSELNEALKRSQLELANTLSELNTLRTTYNTVQGQLNEARATEGLLYQQLKEREKRTEDLQQEVTRLGSGLHGTEEALERLMREQGGRVDQNLVKNLVVGYVQAPDRKKPEVLNLIAKILDFSPSEVQQVQQNRRSGGWLGGLWGRQAPLSPLTPSPKLPVQGASLSQLFVSFLETESLPSLSLPHHSPQAPPLVPPPLGRVPEPDPDRPSRATMGLALSDPPPPTSLHPSQSIGPHLPTNSTQTSSSQRYTDTHNLPNSGITQGLSGTTPGLSGTTPGPSGTTQGPPGPSLGTSVPLSSLTTGLHLSPVTQVSPSSFSPMPAHHITTTTTAQATSSTDILGTLHPPVQTTSTVKTLHPAGTSSQLLSGHQQSPATVNPRLLPAGVQQLSQTNHSHTTGPGVMRPTSPRQQSSILKNLLSPPTS